VEKIIGGELFGVGKMGRELSKVAKMMGRGIVRERNCPDN